MTLTCRGGTLANRFLPFPLSNVSGEAHLSDGVLTLTRATGRHGETVAEARGTFRPAVGGVAGRVEMSATRVPVTAEMRARLPESLRKLHEMLNPTGTAEVRTAVLESEPHVEDGLPKQRWELRELDVTVAGGTARPEKFPYLVTDVRGTAKTDADGVLQLDFRGSAGGRPGVFTGSVVDCGKRCGFEGEVAIAGFPIDRAVRDACPPQVAAALEHLRFTGTGDARLTLSRERGEDRPTHWTLAGPVTGGRARPAGFPYRLEGLSGRVAYDSRDRLWQFEDLRGTHGPANFAGRGVLNGTLDPPRLDLAVTATGVPLDRDLRHALPEGPAAVFDLLRPTGTADADLQLAWSEGEPVWVAARRFRVTGGTANLTAFPLPLRNVSVAGSYAPGPHDGDGTGDGERLLRHPPRADPRRPRRPHDRRRRRGRPPRGRLLAGHAGRREDGRPDIRPGVAGGGPAGFAGRAGRAERPRPREPAGPSAGDAGALGRPRRHHRRVGRRRGPHAERGGTRPDRVLTGGRVTCDGRYDGRRTDLKGVLRSRGRRRWTTPSPRSNCRSRCGATG